jgi:hypothetical protein
MGWKITRWFCLKIVYPLDPIVDHHFPNIHIAYTPFLDKAKYHIVGLSPTLFPSNITMKYHIPYLYLLYKPYFIKLEVNLAKYGAL